MLTMDTARTMVRDGAVAVADGRIVGVGAAADLAARWPARAGSAVPGGS